MPLRCYYEVLSVAQDVEHNEIRKAYRRQALQWHPDKNQHRIEEADERFKEIQNAYDTLSQPQERAWYDSHKDQILRGEEGTNAGRPDEEVNLWPFFNPSAFSGYGAGKKGFYSVYGELFATLARQEMELGGEEFVDLGTANTTSLHVRAFYSCWLNFTTRKEFAWADKYNPTAAPDRKTRRLMEEENVKARRKERREYVDTVRALAAHVRQKDARWAKAQAEAAAKAAEKEQAAARRQKEAKAAKLTQAMAVEEADWIRNSKEAVTFEEEEEERAANALKAAGKATVGHEEDAELYCIVCKKKFRNQNQWRNHEQSKKHLERVAELRAKLVMQEDDSLHEEPLDEDEETAEQGVAHNNRKSKKTNKREKKSAKAAASFHMAQVVAPGQSHTAPKQAEAQAEAEGSEEEEEDQEGSGDEDAMLAAMLGRQRAASRGSAQSEWQSEEQEQESEGSADEADDDDDDDEILAAMMGRHQCGRTSAVQETTSEHSEDEAAVHQVSSGEVEQPVETTVCAEAASEEAGRAEGEGAKAAQVDERDEKGGKRGGKAKEKRAKRAVQSIQKELSAAAEASADDPFACKVCGSSWPSKSKLFKHIKQTGHAALKPL